MKKVSIKGKKYPIEPTMFAQVQFKRDKGMAVSEVKDTDVESLVYYAYLCVKGACMRDDIAFDISFEEFLVKVDGDPFEALLEAKTDEVKKKENLLIRSMRRLSPLGR